MECSGSRFHSTALLLCLLVPPFPVVSSPNLTPSTLNPVLAFLGGGHSATALVLPRVFLRKEGEDRDQASVPEPLNPTSRLFPTYVFSACAQLFRFGALTAKYQQARMPWR